MSTPPSELRALAERLARGAGEIALAGRRTVELDRATKSSATDLVTQFDRAAEEFVVSQLRSERPNDAIVGEEGTSIAGTSGYEWFVDPIDGTTNYVYDQPAWSCSVAVARDGEMLAGAVYAAPLDELYSASRHQGATRNGAPILVSGADELAQALVGTGFGYDPDQRTAQARVVAGLIGKVRDIRRLGSAAFDLCMVACGRLDAYYERDLNAWDAAAGELIAREAGAITSDFGGGPARPAQLVAAAPGVHAALLAALRSV